MDLAFTCTVCKKGFQDSQTRNSDEYKCIQAIKKKVKTAFKCSFCPRKFYGVYSTGRDTHERQHAENPFTKGHQSSLSKFIKSEKKDQPTSPQPLKKAENQQELDINELEGAPAEKIRESTSMPPAIIEPPAASSHICASNENGDKPKTISSDRQMDCDQENTSGDCSTLNEYSGQKVIQRKIEEIRRVIFQKYEVKLVLEADVLIAEYIQKIGDQQKILTTLFDDIVHERVQRLSETTSLNLTTKVQDQPSSSFKLRGSLKYSSPSSVDEKEDSSSDYSSDEQEDSQEKKPKCKSIISSDSDDGERSTQKKFISNNKVRPKSSMTEKKRTRKIVEESSEDDEAEEEEKRMDIVHDDENSENEKRVVQPPKKRLRYSALNKLRDILNNELNLPSMIKRGKENAKIVLPVHKNRSVYHHSTNCYNRPYKCDFVDPKTGPCIFAEKGFTYELNLKHHKMIHTKEFPFICKICKRGCKSCGDLTIHMKAVHQGIRIKCKFCPKTFSTVCNRNQHQNVVHFGLVKYSCNACTYKSSVKHCVDRHIKKIHSKMDKQPTTVRLPPNTIVKKPSLVQPKDYEVKTTPSENNDHSFVYDDNHDKFDDRKWILDTKSYTIGNRKPRLVKKGATSKVLVATYLKLSKTRPTVKYAGSCFMSEIYKRFNQHHENCNPTYSKHYGECGASAFRKFFPRNAWTRDGNNFTLKKTKKSVDWSSCVCSLDCEKDCEKECSQFDDQRFLVTWYEEIPEEMLKIYQSKGPLKKEIKDKAVKYFTDLYNVVLKKESELIDFVGGTLKTMGGLNGNGGGTLSRPELFKQLISRKTVK